MTARSLVLSLLWVTACSTPFRGGYARPDAPLPNSRTLASYVPGHCEDPTRGELDPRFSSVDLVETQTGQLVLCEHRPGYELLVVENHHDEGAYRVFEIVVRGGPLRRFSIPRTPGAVGKLEVGRQISERALGEGFEAGLASSHLTCSLVPKRSHLPHGSTNPVP